MKDLDVKTIYIVEYKTKCQRKYRIYNMIYHIESAARSRAETLKAAGFNTRVAVFTRKSTSR